MSSIPTDIPLDNLRVEEPAIDLGAVMRRFWRCKWIGLGLVLASLVIAVIYLNRASYKYSAELVVAAVDNVGPNSSGGLATLGSLVGVELGGQSATSFGMYSEAIQSYPVAERLSHDRRIMRSIFSGAWDQERGRWREPDSRLSSILKTLYGILHIPRPAWRPPAAEELASYLDANVSAETIKRPGFLKLSFRYEDPAFARYFLGRLHEETDSFVRGRSLSRSGSYINYLEQRLKQVQILEYRQSLAQALGTYEKTHMMASADAPFAAEPFGSVWVSPAPTSPRPAMILVGAVAFGLVLWILFVTLVDPRLSRSRAKADTE